jgi:conjugal transfer mating pair stabilization protein TraG
MDLTVSLTSNAEMFAGAFNAVVRVCHDDSFQIAIKMAMGIGLAISAFMYVKTKDIMVFAKWVALYMFVTIGLLGSSATCWISATTEPTIPPIKVDNVPLGMAVPAYFFTNVGTGLAQIFEEQFSSPSDPAYTQTGMLFGSNLFRLSLSSSFTDPTIQNLMNNFVARCVIGDITISHKYTYDELKNTPDIWGLISQNTSNIRGFYYYDGSNTTFLTCKQAAPVITQAVTKYLNATDGTSIFSLLKNKMGRVTDMENRDIREDLNSAAENFLNPSATAVGLLQQNLMINSVREGIQTMAADENNTGAMQTASNTIAMLKQSMNFSTSYHIGTYDLPIIQTVLLLLGFCSFPLVCILSLLPSLSFRIFINFMYGIVWLESWPLFYAILNFAITFYTHNTSYVDAPTLSNINQLAQEHSDIAGTAGYLILAIPLLSTFLVKGMVDVLAQTAQSIASVAHGSVSSASDMAATGNYSFGNVSMNNASLNNQNFDNIHANKHDTNFSDMHGMSTMQQDNGSLVTTTSGGGMIVNTSTGMSSLGILVGASQSVAHQMQTQASENLSHASNEAMNFDQSRANQLSDGTTVSSSESATQARNMDTMQSIAHDYAQKWGTSDSDAFDKLTQQSATINGSAEFGFGSGSGLSAKIGASASVTGQASSRHSGSYAVDNSHSVSSGDMQKFSEALSSSQSYANSHSINGSMTNAERASYAVGSSVNLAQSLSQSSSDILSQSSNFNANNTQDFVNYAENKMGKEQASQVLSATSGKLYDEQQNLAQSYIKETYKGGSVNTQADSYQIQNYAASGEGSVGGMGASLGANGSSIESARAMNSAASSINQSIQPISGSNASSVISSIDSGKEYAQKGIAHHDFDAAMHPIRTVEDGL